MPPHMSQQRQASSSSSSTGDNKTHVILGVTGSVAAVKAPEIALRLVVEQGLAVKILLTQGGRHFWDQSQNYNGEIWSKFQACLEQESKKDDPCLLVIGEFCVHTNTVDLTDVVSRREDDERSVVLAKISFYALRRNSIVSHYY